VHQGTWAHCKNTISLSDDGSQVPLTLDSAGKIAEVTCGAERFDDIIRKGNAWVRRPFDLIGFDIREPDELRIWNITLRNFEVLKV
jgi:hypothetical protein